MVPTAAKANGSSVSSSNLIAISLPSFLKDLPTPKISDLKVPELKMPELSLTGGKDSEPMTMTGEEGKQADDLMERLRSKKKKKDE